MNVTLNSKNEISTDVYHKNTNTHDYLPYDSARPESCKKNVPYNLAKRIIFSVINPERVELRLNELRIWLKNILMILFQMIFTVLNFKVLLLHPSTKIQTIRL